MWTIGNRAAEFVCHRSVLEDITIELSTPLVAAICQSLKQVFRNVCKCIR